MLYKNDEPYKLAPADIKLINDRFHSKWPLNIVYPPERIVPSRSKKNRLPDKPNSASWPLTAIVRTDSGIEQWRYAENVIVKEHGVRKYTPKNIMFNGRRALTKGDIELVWFLYTKSEYCKGGLNQGNKVKFMFEDLITAAELKAEKESMMTQVKTMIHSKDFGLSEQKLRIVAKAYFVKNVDDLTFAQVKLALEHNIMRDKEKGMKKFIEMIDLEELVKTRVKIQEVIDKGFLKYAVDKKEWVWIEEGQKPNRLFKVPVGINADDAIYDYYMGNKEFQENVELAGKTKKQKAE